MKLAVLGTGLMGAAAAQRFYEQGYQVTAWNRSRGTAEKRLPSQIPFDSDLAAVVADVEVLLVFLADAAAVRETIGSLPAGALGNKTLIQMGTIAPEESRELLNAMEAVGAAYLEAPVLGSLPEVKSGALLLMVGATQVQFQQYAELFEVLGNNPMWVGPVGQAAALKLAMNQLIAGLTSSFSLSLAFVQQQGVAVEQFMQVLRSSALYAPTFDKKLDKMRSDDYENPNFPLKHLLKDVGLFLKASSASGLDTGQLSAIQETLQRSLQKGDAELDYSVLYRSIAGKS